MERYVLSLDQGTTSSRAILFTKQGKPYAQVQHEFKQYYPHPGWVEHNPAEILSTQFGSITEVMAAAGVIPEQIDSIGITNQRETTLVWNRETGQPVYNAIVWQCRRTAYLVDEVCGEPETTRRITAKTGLVPDAYFSASKIAWILREVPGAAAAASVGALAFGTVDSWLIWNLTNGAVHATDVTNASRTMLFNIHTGCWDEELLSLFGIPASMMPQVLPSSGLFGTTEYPGLPEGIPICGVAGDQQAALFGQCCFESGQAKNTYGTGCFMLMHTGSVAVASKHGLVTTVVASAPNVVAGVQTGTENAQARIANTQADAMNAADVSGAAALSTVAPAGSALPLQGAEPAVPLSLSRQYQQPLHLEYALEGSVFVAGALLQWLRDELGLITNVAETEAIAQSVPDTAGVVMVPAFTGLGAPYWNADARGAIYGLTRGANKAHVVRAALESLAYQVADVAHIMELDSGQIIGQLKVDGGAAANNFLMQFQADILNTSIVRPAMLESTALGAAFLAGLFTGFWETTSELVALRAKAEYFKADMPEAQRSEYLERWHEAVRRTM